MKYQLGQRVMLKHGCLIHKYAEVEGEIVGMPGSSPPEEVEQALKARVDYAGHLKVDTNGHLVIPAGRVAVVTKDHLIVCPMDDLSEVPAVKG